MKDNVKYLGITIQDDLGWEIHANNLLKKLRQFVAILSKVMRSAIFHLTG